MSAEVIVNLGDGPPALHPDVLGRVSIPRRFCGPLTSANGGYVCGLLAYFIGASAQVTLRRPPPLERPLHVIEGGGGRIVLTDGDSEIADAVRGEAEVAVPAPVTMADAAMAQRILAGHPFPSCFVCGPESVEGLRIFPGPVPGTELVAAPWVPAAELAGPDDHVRPEFVWAALDCPGGFAAADLARRPVVLGRLTAQLLLPVDCRDPYVVVGWPLGRDGRKRFAGTAIFSRRDELVAVARAVWLEVKPERSPVPDQSRPMDSTATIPNQQEKSDDPDAGRHVLPHSGRRDRGLPE